MAYEDNCCTKEQTLQDFKVFNLPKGQDITPTNDNQPETYPTTWIKYDEITMDLEDYDTELIEG